MSNLTLSGGINNVQHPGNLPANVQPSIKNITFDATGKLAIHKEYEEMARTEGSLYATIFEQGQTIKKIYQWFPAYLPVGFYADDGFRDVFIVFYIDTMYSPAANNVKIVYRTGASDYKASTLTTDDITVNEVIADADSWQFIFVDGRAGHKARRIVIDQNGIVTISYIGMTAIFIGATVKSVLFVSDDDVNTGIGQGNVFAYRYVFRNQYGEQSPVSPLTVFDLLDYKKRGETVDGTYTYDSIAHGSLQEIQLEIPVPADAYYLDLYRQDADGCENEQGFNQMRLVKSIFVKDSETPLTVKDNYPYGATAINLLQDDSPKADFLAINNGSIYFSNATNTPNFPYSIALMWKIYIPNNNPIAYLNKFVEFDLFDLSVHPTTAGSYVDASMADVLPVNMRFMDTDMITALESYWSDAFDKQTYDLPTNTQGFVHRLVKIRIPERLPFTTNVIYLVIAGDPDISPVIYATPNPLAFGSVYPAVD